MKSKAIFLFIILMIISGNAYAQAYLRGELSGQSLEFNQYEQYLTISVDGVYPPVIEDSNFLEKLFLDKMDYILCKVTIYLSGDPENKITIIPFSLEKLSKNKYTSDTINPGASYTVINLLKFPYGDKLKMDVELMAWEGEENYAMAKTIFSSVSGLDLLAPEVMTYIEVGLDLIEKLYPSKKAKDSVHDSFEKNDITSEDYKIITNYNGNEKDLLKLKFESTNAIFSGCNFEPVYSLNFFNDREAWRKALRRSAEESTANNSPEAIRSVMLAFSDYINTKPLVKKDKTLFAAGALHTWVTNSVKNCIGDGCISAGLFQEMPIGDLLYIRPNNTCWDFSGVDCTTQACVAMSSFLRKSKTINGRQEAAENHIESDFSLYLDGNLIADIDTNKYLNNFVIKRVSSFTTLPGGEELIYAFEKGSLDLRYREDENSDYVNYRNKNIKIYQYAKKEGYFISQIEMLSTD